MRWKLLAAGVVVLVMWFGCWAMTVVPETSAVTEQWAAANFLAFLAGGLFAAAVCGRRNVTGSTMGDNR